MEELSGKKSNSFSESVGSVVFLFLALQTTVGPSYMFLLRPVGC